MKTKIALTDFGKEDFDVFYSYLNKIYGTDFVEVDLFSTLLGYTAKTISTDSHEINEYFRIIDLTKGGISAKEAINQVKFN